jgi:hypothetical protein
VITLHICTVEKKYFSEEKAGKAVRAASAIAARQRQRAYLQAQAAVQRYAAESGRWGLRGCAPVDTGAKIPLDNHLEGSSIKRYSEVAEAMSNRRYHPIEETEDATIRRD